VERRRHPVRAADPLTLRPFIHEIPDHRYRKEKKRDEGTDLAMVRS
jgi:hypothetical protein